MGEEDEGRVDRISSLPDAVLGDIISLLPADEGARTQILASKWRHLWLSAPLNLDCADLLARYSDHGIGEHAAGVVSRILSSHSGPGRRLRMEGDHFGLEVATNTMDSWLRSGALDNLQELQLGYYSTEAPLPSYTFRFAPTLRVATIKKCNLPDGTLRSIGVDNDNSVYPNRVHLEELIVENAPSLEKLLRLHYGTGLHISVVSAPQLETIGYLSDGDYWFQDNPYSKLVFGSTIIQVPLILRLFKFNFVC
uniref:F-box/LRR-repeat protein 15/At3g58940/PEG3-like LRR domain-containing protein n=1 Tax=Triticum urartu TaxID=4572 RepID=A0A8R7QB26_TRIUA